MTTAITYTSFDGNKRIASGSLQTNALAVKQALAARSHGAVLTFNDQTGETVEIDVCGTDADILSRLRGLTPSAPAILSEEPNAEPVPESRGRGRPKLGVVSREITLLSRHWEWLESQPGAASVTLRKLVEKARKAGAKTDRQRHMQERTTDSCQLLRGTCLPLKKHPGHFLPVKQNAFTNIPKAGHLTCVITSGNWHSALKRRHSPSVRPPHPACRRTFRR